MTERQQTGQTGEQIAAGYLTANGFTILHTNWRAGHREVDIVAAKNNRLHVIEVRSRHSAALLQPYQSVDRAKQRHLIAAANAYIARYRRLEEVQIDIISIVFHGTQYSLEYLPAAVYPQAGTNALK